MLHPDLHNELARATHEERLRKAAKHRRAASVARPGRLVRLLRGLPFLAAGTSEPAPNPPSLETSELLRLQAQQLLHVEPDHLPDTGWQPPEVPPPARRFTRRREPRPGRAGFRR